MAKRVNAHHLGLLSSAGAHPDAYFFEYFKLKGKLEVEIAALKLKSMTLYRPGVLIYGEIEGASYEE